MAASKKEINPFEIRIVFQGEAVKPAQEETTRVVGAIALEKANDDEEE